MWKLEVEEACWGTISIFTDKLEDLELYEWVLVVHEQLMFVCDLLTYNKLRREVPDDLRAIGSSPLGCQI